MSTLGRSAGKVVDTLTKIPISLDIPSGMFAHTKALGVRTGNISELKLEPELLSPKTKVLMMPAQNDELFNAKKSVEDVKRVYPQTKVVWLPGGHHWNENKTKAAGEMVFDFLKS